MTIEYLIGVDLSGPSNAADTAVTVFKSSAPGLTLQTTASDVSDAELVRLIKPFTLCSKAVVGVDAPLSYNDGGGDRPADRSLRQRIVQVGLAAGSVMPPTMTRMAYLTLRGLAVARLLSGLPNPPLLVEVHPGAAMALRNAPVEDIRLMKKERSAQRRLLGWLEDQGLEGVAAVKNSTDHYVASCAAALAAWRWEQHRAEWIHPADPPLHPFDFAC